MSDLIARARELCGPIEGTGRDQATVEIIINLAIAAEALEAEIEQLRVELRGFRECICPVTWEWSCPSHVPAIG